jgi:hypothetical protein
MKFQSIEEAVKIHPKPWLIKPSNLGGFTVYDNKGETIMYFPYSVECNIVSNEFNLIELLIKEFNMK